MGDAPIDDADELAAARIQGSQAKLSTGVTCCFQDGDAMAALSGDARCFEPCWPGADNDNVARRALRLHHVMGHRGLAAGGRIVNTQRIVAFVEPVEAVGGANAGADVLFPALNNFSDNMRIGDVRPGHADEIELAFGDGMAGSGDVVDAGRMENRKLGKAANLCGEIQMRRGAHAADRDDFGQRRIVLDVTFDDVQKVDQTRLLECPADRQAFFP